MIKENLHNDLFLEKPRNGRTKDVTPEDFPADMRILDVPRKTDDGVTYDRKVQMKTPSGWLNLGLHDAYLSDETGKTVWLLKPDYLYLLDIARKESGLRPFTVNEEEALIQHLKYLAKPKFHRPEVI